MPIAESVSEQPSSRLLLIDCFRLLCILFIAHFHVWMVVVGEDSSYSYFYPLFNVLEQTHAFGFDRAGQWIALLSFFLFGYNGRLSAWRLPLFLAGILSVQFVGTGLDDAFSVDSFSWGVFSLILCSYLFLMMTVRLRARRAAAVRWAAVALLFISHAQWREIFSFLEPGLLKQALIGDVLESHVVTGWFLLPWFGAMVAAFEVGVRFKKHAGFFSVLKWYDAIPVLMALVMGFVVYATSAEFAGGANFNFAIFWTSPLATLWTALVPLIVCRFAVASRVQNALARNAFAKAIGELRWNRDFWLCYLFHFVLLLVISRFFDNETLREPWILQALPIVSFVTIEIYVRVSIPPNRQGWIFRAGRRKLSENLG